ncbi:NIPSNAP family protein [Pseudonocardia acaciae]|uniref:NIPSNAP family protein n=1 Tax=Pseudonocardia acaciae TaxID=551276 RepID=UPI0004916CB3|nr:NIPSNAP family protein [Pseudonocardia acaciae]
MIYEIREYTTVPGRMPALVKRFNEHTLRLFEQHGMDLEFISLTAVGENSTNELVYVLRFADYADMERKWAEFVADPEWQRVQAESERDGPILARLARRVLNPTPFER